MKENVDQRGGSEPRTTLTNGELLACVKLVLDRAASRGFSSIDDSRYEQYWTVTTPDWVSLDASPEPVVGSLKDDLGELRQLLEDPSRVSIVDIQRLASALLLLSQTIEDCPNYVRVE